MAKNNETVGWEMDWADVAEEPAFKQEVHPKDAATQETPSVAKAETLPDKREENVPSTATQSHSKQEPAVSAERALTKESVSSTHEGVPVQRQEVSLTKEPGIIVRKEAYEQNGAAAKAQFTPQEVQPPPLPITARAETKALFTDHEVQAPTTKFKRPDSVTTKIDQPPSLPKKTKVSQASDRPVETPEPADKAPPAGKTVRKPPGGISSIFKREEPTDSPEPSPVADAHEVPAGPVAPHPTNPQVPGHPKLGLAFQTPPQQEESA